MDRGAQWAMVHGVTKSWMWLKQLDTTQILYITTPGILCRNPAKDGGRTGIAWLWGFWWALRLPFCLAAAEGGWRWTQKPPETQITLTRYSQRSNFEFTEFQQQCPAPLSFRHSPNPLVAQKMFNMHWNSPQISLYFSGKFCPSHSLGIVYHRPEYI